MPALSKLGRGVHLKLGKDRDGAWHAIVRFNGGDQGEEGISVQGFSFSDVGHALRRATTIAHKVLNVPGMKLLLPPGAGGALEIAAKLGHLASQGLLTSKGQVLTPTGPQSFESPVLRKLAAQMAQSIKSGNPGAMAGCAHTLVGCGETAGDMGRGGFRGGGFRGYRHRPQYAPPRHWRPHYAQHPHHHHRPQYAPPAPAYPVFDPYAYPMPPDYDPASTPPDPHPASTPAAADPASTAPAPQGDPNAQPDPNADPSLQGVFPAGAMLNPYSFRAPGVDFAAAKARIYGPQDGMLRFRRWPL